ncbi:hypothetical protein [Streptomyces sp. NPDC089919]|uniref:D-alanyl-D-alanine carboxypeptidase family protein n=1 Tax=Streptomyces sp. NPDC089919 TaxID=3155188 RepID=UPI003436A80A
MAGESPDKSVEQGSSGTTAQNPPEHDPRLSLFGPRSTPAAAPAEDAPEPAGDAEPGAAAEAAPAAPGAPAAVEESPEAADAPEEPQAAVREPAPAEPTGPEAAKLAATEPEAAKPAAAEPAAAEPEPETAEPEADEPEPKADEPKATEPEAAEPAPAADGFDVFARPARRTPPAGEPAASAKPPVDPRVVPGQGAGRSEDEGLRSAVAAWVASTDQADANANTEAPAAGGAPTAEPTAEPAAPSAAKPGAQPLPDSERTAVFRAPRLPEADPAPAPAADKPATEPATGGPAAPKPPVDESEKTAVFRVTKPPTAPADPADDVEKTTVFRAVKPPTAGPAPQAPAPAPGRTAPASDRDTAVFGTGPARPQAPGQGGSRNGDQGPGGGTAAQPKNSSTFVPLRGDDAPPVRETPRTAPPAPAPAAHPGLAESERTKQQPMPPRPPLDMLAELSNNPPPPPSALRTTIRRFKIWTPLVVLLAIVFVVVQLVRPLPDPKLVMTAKENYSFAGEKPTLPWPEDGQAYMAAAGLGTVGSFGEQKPVPIASVTKSMTAYIILRDHPLKRGEKGPMIDIDQAAEDEGRKDKSDNESTLNTVQKGQQISEYDALAALMIPSANNIARLLARWDAGDQAAFVKKMNDTARELGMANTTYTDPSGLDATTVSTAEDQVKLGLKLVEIKALMDITKLPYWVDPSGKKWRNWNDLVPYNGALGIKTGSTTAAGGNLLFAAHKMVGKTDQLIVGAVLAQHTSHILDDAIAASKRIMLATQDMLVSAKVVKKGDVVGYVDDGLGGQTPLVATADVDAIGWPSVTVDIRLTAKGKKGVPHTAADGSRIGTLTIGSGASQVKVPVAVQGALAEPGIGSKLTRVG